MVVDTTRSPEAPIAHTLLSTYMYHYGQVGFLSGGARRLCKSLMHADAQEDEGKLQTLAGFTAGAVGNGRAGTLGRGSDAAGNSATVCVAAPPA